MLPFGWTLQTLMYTRIHSVLRAYTRLRSVLRSSCNHCGYMCCTEEDAACHLLHVHWQCSRQHTSLHAP